MNYLYLTIGQTDNSLFIDYSGIFQNLFFSPFLHIYFSIQLCINVFFNDAFILAFSEIKLK